MKKFFLYVLWTILVFVIYLYTSYPTIPPYRDSGDLITAGYTLGIPHPPGYPLYSVLGKIFSVIIPYGNIAYRLNLMSVFFSIFTGIIIILMFSSSNEFLTGIIVASVYIFSKSVWSLSHVSEMYTISTFFVALIFFVLIKFNISIQIKYLYLVSFLSGLSTGAHPTVILIIPGLFLWLFYEYKYKLTTKYLLVIILAFLIGFSIYLYLPLRSVAEPVLDSGNPQTFTNFIRVITRADYGGLKLHPEESKFVWDFKSVYDQILLFIKALIEQFTIPGFIMGLCGIYFLWKQKKLTLVVLGFIITGPGFFILANLPVDKKTTLPILEPNMVLPGLLFVMLIGFLFNGVYKTKIYGLCAIFGIGLSGYLLINNFNIENRRDHFFAYDYGKNLLRTINYDSILYDTDDATTFIIMYIKYCEKKRDDIKLVTYFRTRWGYENLKKLYPKILPDKNIGSAQELINTIFEYNLQKRFIYTDISTKVPQNYIPLSNGLMYLITKTKMMLEPRANYFKLYIYRGEYNTSKYTDFFTQRIFYYYSSAFNNLGLEYFNSGQIEKSKYCYQTAISIDPYLPEAYNNLGTLVFRIKQYDTAIKYFYLALELKPNDITILFNLGLSYKLKNDLLNAEKCFNKILINTKNYAPAENELGLIALYKGEIQKSISIFENIIKHSPDYYIAYYNLGLAYQTAGNLIKSKYFYNIYQKYVSEIK